MIKVTSANNKEDFFINHRKIQTIKQLGKNLHIVLENGKTFIVTNDIEDIKNNIIKFENSIMYLNKIDESTNKEVSINE